jgi:hypothetical protein
MSGGHCDGLRRHTLGDRCRRPVCGGVCEIVAHGAYLMERLSRGVEPPGERSKLELVVRPASAEVSSSSSTLGRSSAGTSVSISSLIDLGGTFIPSRVLRPLPGPAACQGRSARVTVAGSAPPPVWHLSSVPAQVPARRLRRCHGGVRGARPMPAALEYNSLWPTPSTRRFSRACGRRDAVERAAAHVGVRPLAVRGVLLRARYR